MKIRGEITLFSKAIIKSSLLLFFVMTGVANAELYVGKPVAACAKNSDARRVAAFYTENTGAPTPIPARALKIPELHVVTGLPTDNRVGTEASEKLLEDLWLTIDAWGEDTRVNLVYTMGGQHVIDFPSLIPYRDNSLFRLLAIYAVHLPCHEG